MPKKSKPELDQAADSLPAYSGNVEAHIIADMLRIEGLTSEIKEFKASFKEFKVESKERFDKLEGWIIRIVGITVTTLIAAVGTLIIKLMGI